MTLNQIAELLKTIDGLTPAEEVDMLVRAMGPSLSAILLGVEPALERKLEAVRAALVELKA